MDYIYHRYVFDFDKMEQFPKNLRTWLTENCIISMPKVITESVSPDGKTRVNCCWNLVIQAVLRQC